MRIFFTWLKAYMVYNFEFIVRRYFTMRKILLVHIIYQYVWCFAIWNYFENCVCNLKHKTNFLELVLWTANNNMLPTK